MNNDNSEDHFSVVTSIFVTGGISVTSSHRKGLLLMYIGEPALRSRQLQIFFVSSEEFQVTNDRFFPLHSSLCLTDVSYFQFCLKITATVPGHR